MPEKDAELTTLENAEGAGQESPSAETTELAAAEVKAEEPPVNRAEFDQLQAEFDQLKKERDGLVDRLARLQASAHCARR